MTNVYVKIFISLFDCLVCSEAIPNCQECSNSITCETCDDLFFFDKSINQCISCESETYSDTENGRDQCYQNQPPPQKSCNYIEKYHSLITFVATNSAGIIALLVVMSLGVLVFISSAGALFCWLRNSPM